MDGVKRSLRHSLQFQLSCWLSLALVCVALAIGIFSFYSAADEANELQDDQLRQMAKLLNPHSQSLGQPLSTASIDMSDPESRMVIQLLDPHRVQSTRIDGEKLPLPASLAPGIHTLCIGQTSWRIFVRRLAHGQNLAVGQVTEVRDAVARRSGLSAILPLLLMIPLLLGLISVLVRQKFKPLLRLSTELDQRNENDLAPLNQARIPSEILPFTASINRLLLRVEQSLEMQRCFIADASHELRSPFTALSLQAEALQNCALPPEALERLTALRQGVMRTRTLLEQLLSLARAQDKARSNRSRISLQAVFRRVLEDLLPLAEKKHIDLGAVFEQDVELEADALDLHTLVRNLLDNAIRYTPSGGRVDLDLRQEGDAALLEVIDNGPGIAAEERNRVFDSFYRVLGNEQQGSGLGLSIVKVIVERLGGRISLSDAHPGAQPPGLCFRVTLPLQAPVHCTRALNPSQQALSRLPPSAPL